jgi:hypothetical protein
MDKFTQWFLNQSQYIQQDLNNRPIWTDRDIYTVFVLGIILGIVITLLAGL